MINEASTGLATRRTAVFKLHFCVHSKARADKTVAGWAGVVNRTS